MSTHSTTCQAAPRRTHRGAVAAVLVAVVAVLAGCGSSAADSEDYGGDMATAAYAESDSPAGGFDLTFASEEGASDDSDRGSTANEASSPDRSVIVTGSLYITVEDPIVAADRAAGIVRNAGGRIDARNETTADEYTSGSASLTLRIPSDRLDAVVEDLRGLGTVDQFSTDSYDVTVEVTDLEARISTLRASTLRIEALLVDAEDIADIIKLEKELSGRQADLESLEARQRGLTDQVSMSTIELSLTTEPVVIAFIDDDPQNFWDGLVTGWSALVGFFTAALIVVGVLLPWLALIAIVTLAIIAAVRARQSRKPSRSPAATPAPVAPDQPAVPPSKS